MAVSGISESIKAAIRRWRLLRLWFPERSWNVPGTRNVPGNSPGTFLERSWNVPGGVLCPLVRALQGPSARVGEGGGGAEGAGEGGGGGRDRAPAAGPGVRYHGLPHDQGVQGGPEAGRPGGLPGPPRGACHRAVRAGAAGGLRGGAQHRGADGAAGVRRCLRGQAYLCAGRAAAHPGLGQGRARGVPRAAGAGGEEGAGQAVLVLLVRGNGAARGGGGLWADFWLPRTGGSVRREGGICSPARGFQC
mmetsp:Transcript_31173/g.49050  ORF Transcript_31173/g.49050 Transcript_31173/m.49050 type:complete len:248 (-) Transcript_31173:342-1085(-)